MNNYVREYTLAAILVALAVLLVNPFDFWMPSMLAMTMVAVFVAAFLAFGVFIWREGARDERENLHKLFAGRIAFLLGGATLVGGIVAQSLHDAIDPWLVWALVIMVLGKIGALIYESRRG